ncbi:hypothetical protein GOFOIKOB_6594 [Methylobacterium tardum]|nr:hypothetical protein GOFOIKOB_6594 [Methylobacterium tardum]
MSIRWYQPHGRYIRRCASASGSPFARSAVTSSFTCPERAFEATSTASGVDTTTTSSRPTTAVTPSPWLWTRLFFVSISDTRPRTALPASSWSRTCQTASQVPTSDQGNDTGSTPAWAVRSITA